MFAITRSLPLAALDGTILTVLGDAAIKIGALFVLAALTTVLLCRSSASVRHSVWLVAVVSFLLLPVLSPALPQWQVLPSWFDAGHAALGGPGLRGTLLADPARAPGAGPLNSPGAVATEAALTSARLARSVAAPSTEARAPGISSSALPSLSRIAFLAWLIGFGLILLRVVASRLILSGVSCAADAVEPGPIGDVISEMRRQLGISRRVDACLSPRRGTPMTWGFWHTHLLLPADATSWPPRRLRAVLLHEFAHVQRFDTLCHVIMQLACAFYWFHPLVWLAARKAREECERACDDLVLHSGVRASDYAEDLLGILVPRSVPAAALAIAGRSELEGRVRAILSEKAVRQPVSRRGLSVAAMAGLLFTTALASLHASSPQVSEPPVSLDVVSGPTTPQPQPAERVTVVCVDPDGKPVAGAEIHMFQYAGTVADGRFVHTGPFTSDEQGKAVCSDAIRYNRGCHDRWFYARIPGRIVGVARSMKWTNRAAFNTEGRVVMQASRSVEGKASVPEGFDPTKMVVRVRTLQISTGPGDMDFEPFPREDHFPGLDTSLPEIFECRPDAKGHIRFGDVPVRGRLYLVTAGAGLAEAQWSNYQNRDMKFDQAIQLTIAEEGILSGRIVAPDGKPAIGLRVTARLSPVGQRPIAYLSSFRAVTDEDGTFVIHGLPETEFELSVHDPKKLWAFRPRENLLVHPRENRRLTLTMETGTRVSGRVLNTDGKPVEAAGIAAVADDKRASPVLGHDSTDADGRYEFRLPAGDAFFYFNGLPDGYAYPDPQIIKHLKIQTGQGAIRGVDFTIPRRSR